MIKTSHSIHVASCDVVCIGPGNSMLCACPKLVANTSVTYHQWHLVAFISRYISLRIFLLRLIGECTGRYLHTFSAHISGTHGISLHLLICSCCETQKINMSRWVCSIRNCMRIIASIALLYCCPIGKHHTWLF